MRGRGPSRSLEVGGFDWEFEVNWSVWEYSVLLKVLLDNPGAVR